MKNNKSLFWYGFFGNLKQGGGKTLMWISFFIFLFGIMGSESLIFLSIIGFIVGIILLMQGKSQRFDYQRQSGYIMHGGDR